MDNDNDLDLVVGCRKGPIYYFERDDSGNLKEGVSLFDVPQWSNSNPFVTDWNGDNKLDILATGYHTYDGVVPVYILLNTGTNKFEIDTTKLDSINAPLLNEKELYRTVLMGDMDKDGLKDLIIGHTGNLDDPMGYVLIRWYKNMGTTNQPIFNDYHYFKFANDKKIGFNSGDFNLPYITLHDANNDGNDDIILGMSKGGAENHQLVAWIQDNTTSTNKFKTFKSNSNLKIYNGHIYGDFINIRNISLHDLKGREIFSKKTISEKRSIPLPSSIGKGFFILSYTGDLHKKTSLISIK